MQDYPIHFPELEVPDDTCQLWPESIVVVHISAMPDAWWSSNFLCSGWGLVEGLVEGPQQGLDFGTASRADRIPSQLGHLRQLCARRYFLLGANVVRATIKLIMKTRVVKGCTSATAVTNVTLSGRSVAILGPRVRYAQIARHLGAKLCSRTARKE